jgi:hypothetical protein
MHLSLWSRREATRLNLTLVLRYNSSWDNRVRGKRTVAGKGYATMVQVEYCLTGAAGHWV